MRCDGEKASVRNLYGSTNKFDHQAHHMDEFIAKLQGLAPEPVDSFIVVKRCAMNFVPLAPDYIWGYGSTIFCRCFLNLPVIARLYIGFDIIVINARTMKVAAIGYAQPVTIIGKRWEGDFATYGDLIAAKRI